MTKQPPDGDCFFHSIAHEAARIKGKKLKTGAGPLIRAELFRQVRDDHAWSIEGKSVHYWVTLCTGMSASRYLESMRANAGRSSWGGFLEAALLANKLSIRVHMSDAL